MTHTTYGAGIAAVSTAAAPYKNVTLLHKLPKKI